MSVISRAKEGLLLEARSIQNAAERLDKNFEDAVNFLFQVKGRVITSGIGKSGHIARKAAATFASTGTPSFFVDPVECMHGDFGMITDNDVMVLYSKSGEAVEMSNMVNWLTRQSIQYIAITNEVESTMSTHAHIVLLTHVEREACPLNLAPTSSSTVSLALSDVLAISLMNMHNFVKCDFFKFHPGGSLGKQLTTIEHIMHTDDLPIIDKNDKDITLRNALHIINDHHLGMLIVLDGDILEGILVDGDFKRILLNTDNIEGVLNESVLNFINKKPITMNKDAFIMDALDIMEGRITNLVVTKELDNGHKFLGILHIHDILKYKAI